MRLTNEARRYENSAIIVVAGVTTRLKERRRQSPAASSSNIPSRRAWRGLVKTVAIEGQLSGEGCF